MTEARRRHGRWFDLVATVLIGLVVTAAALVPAATANSGETTTIRGDVTVSGRPLAFFPVGFWVPGTGALARGSTDANGVFTLDVPSIRDGYAYAGTEPDAERTILDSDGMHVVRGTIGAKAAKPISSPLYQGWDTATGRQLAGGAAQLHFRLQEAGRIDGVLPLPRSEVRAVQVRRLDGSTVETPTPDSRGRWRSMLLAPGDYAVAVVPKAPLLPVAVRVAVRAAATVRATLPKPVTGATVQGVLRADTGVAVQGVPVLLQQDGTTVAETTAGSGGAYRFTGLAAGDYVVVAGTYPDEAPTTPAPSAVPAPVSSAAASDPAPTTGATPSASPTPTATPTPSPSQQVVQPVVRTSDAVLPASTDVTVPEAPAAVTADVTTEAAGRLSGTVAGADGQTVQVVVEDAATGEVLRTATPDQTGSWRVGGLTPGQECRIWAVTRPADATQARMGDATAVAIVPGAADAGSTTVLIDRAAATLSGTVSGASGGRVTVGADALLQRTSTVDASGAYAVLGLVPGLYPVVVAAPERLVSDPVAVAVQEDGGAQDLQRGPAPATYKGWFISGGDGVSLVSGTATSTTGARVTFGPRVVDGHVTETDLRPGQYLYDDDSFDATVPALDGPWWFAPPDGGFALSDGATTDVQAVVLHVRAH